MAVAMSVSIAAIIYQGPLSVFVARGVALTLIGGIVMGAVGACLFSWRGAICSPQSTLAVVIALFAGTVAAAGPADERAFATVSAYVAATTLAIGAAAWLLGRLRVGMLAGYFPLPVVSGFLAATGYLLVMGGLGMAIGHQVTARNLPLLFGSPAARALAALGRRGRRDRRADPPPAAADRGAARPRPRRRRLLPRAVGARARPRGRPARRAADRPVPAGLPRLVLRLAAARARPWALARRPAEPPDRGRSRRRRHRPQRSRRSRSPPDAHRRRPRPAGRRRSPTSPPASAAGRSATTRWR